MRVWRHVKHEIVSSQCYSLWIQQSCSVQCLRSPLEHTRPLKESRLNLYTLHLQQKRQFNRNYRKTQGLNFFPALFSLRAPRFETSLSKSSKEKTCLCQRARQESSPNPMSPQIKPNWSGFHSKIQRRSGASVKRKLHSTLLVTWLEK